MPKTDIKLYSTEPSGKATTATISDVNPDATNDELKTLGQMLNSFTRNRYDKTNRINTIQCDTEPGGGSQTATITLATPSATLADVKTAFKTGERTYRISNITYDGDGQLYAYALTGHYVGVSLAFFDSSTNTYTIPLYTSSIDPLVEEMTAPTIIKIRADATDTYKAAEATFTITA